MTEKDILEKILLSYADVFADCENALLYGGSQVLRAADLRPAPTESFYRGGGDIHNQFCDVGAYHMVRRQILAHYIIENETHIRKRQVLRKVSYQGGAYRAQLESGRPVYPVFVIVLDWTGKTSRIPLSLHELLVQNGMPRAGLHLVDDVTLSVYHMHNLPKEIRSCFTSDMGFVVDFLNEGSFENRRNQRILHVEALCEMMEALTKDTRFTELSLELSKKQEKKEGIMMCEYIDMLEARGEKRGIEIGVKKGVKKGIRKGVKKGEDKLSALLTKLYSLGRDEDAKLAATNARARQQFYKEFTV